MNYRFQLPSGYIPLCGEVCDPRYCLPRPRRVGMLTVAVKLSKALVAHKGKDEFTLLRSNERPANLEITDERITEIYEEIVETIRTGSPAKMKALTSPPTLRRAPRAAL